MAGFRKPGPQCASTDQLKVDRNTFCRSLMPPPGPVCVISETPERERDAPKDSEQGIHLALAAIRRETATEVGGVLRGRVPDLLNALQKAVIHPTTHSRALSLSLPIPRVHAVKNLLILLGLDFLSESGSWDELIVTLAKYGSRITAWPRATQVYESKSAQMAPSVGILVRCVLQGIIRESNTTPQRPHTRMDAPANLIARLRVSRLGEPFAAWVVDNWNGLLENARLRRADTGDQGIFTIASNLGATRQARVTVTSEPVIDPPTFPDDTDLIAQAAALVAAAAQGMPFCPI